MKTKKAHPQKRAGSKNNIDTATFKHLSRDVRNATAGFWAKRGLPPTGEDLPESKRHLHYGHHNHKRNQAVGSL